jgi:hypothetical protein
LVINIWVGSLIFLLPFHASNTLELQSLHVFPFPLLSSETAEIGSSLMSNTQEVSLAKHNLSIWGAKKDNG